MDLVEQPTLLPVAAYQRAPDYWALNAVTVPDRYPLPLVSQLLSKIRPTVVPIEGDGMDTDQQSLFSNASEFTSPCIFLTTRLVVCSGSPVHMAT